MRRERAQPEMNDLLVKLEFWKFLGIKRMSITLEQHRKMKIAKRKFLERSL